MRAEQDAQLHALQESAAASLTVSEASGAEGAALRSEIGRLEAALSDAASEHAAAIEASATEGAALRSEIGRLEAVLSEAAAEPASGNAVAVGQEQQQKQLPQAARPSTSVAVCALRELPLPVQATHWHNPAVFTATHSRN